MAKKNIPTLPDKPPTTTTKDNATPKSFVFKNGKVTKNTAQLILDLRRVMEPNTATKLRERAANKLKDYMSVAGPLGVSHFMTFSQGEESLSLRMARFAGGPTCHFKVLTYSLHRDVLGMQKKPRPPGPEAFRSAPLLVLNNFDLSTSEGKLLCSFLQNTFPTMNTTKLNLPELRRVVLFEYNKDTDSIDFRHYQIGVKETGLSKPIRRLLRAPTQDLANQPDLAEYILKGGDGTATSESEVEEDSMVTLPQDYKGSAKNSQRAVTLTEIGPRMTLQLLKITDGFFDGNTLYKRSSNDQGKSQPRQ